MGLGSGFGSFRQGLGFRVHGVRIMKFETRCGSGHLETQHMFLAAVGACSVGTPNNHSAS